MTDSNPFDIFRTESPLQEIPQDSVDEFLARITEDLVAGQPAKVTGERLEQLAAMFREEATTWEIKQREAPERKGRSKKTIADALDIDITL
jgi:hypothetical protein